MNRVVINMSNSPGAALQVASPGASMVVERDRICEFLNVVPGNDGHGLEIPCDRLADKLVDGVRMCEGCRAIMARTDPDILAAAMICDIEAGS